MSDRLSAWLDAVLAAADAPDDGAAWHALLADDAPLFRLGEVVLRRDWPADAFVAEQQAYPTLNAEAAASARVAFERTGPWAPGEPDAEGAFTASAGVQASRAGAEASLTAVLGVAPAPDGGWKLRWATLRPAGGPAWTPARGLMETLAEAPLATRPELALPRTWFEVAFFRLRGRAEPTLILDPTTRFSCHMNGTCCRYDYAIAVPHGAQAMIDALPLAELRPDLVGLTLEKLSDEYLMLKRNGERCPFVDAERHCTLHRFFGRPVFAPCVAFPFAFVETPEGVRATASGLCDSVAAGLGAPLDTPERREDLYFRMAYAPPLTAEAFRLAPGGPDDWPAFRDFTAALDADLAGGLPLAEALARAGARLPASETPAWPTSPLPPGSARYADELLEAMVARGGASLQAVWAAHRAPACPARAESPALRRILSTAWFGRRMAADYDATTALGWLAAVWLLGARLEALDRPAGAAPALHELGVLAHHMGLARDVLGLPESPSPLRGAFGDPDFARFLIATLEPNFEVGLAQP